MIENHCEICEEYESECTCAEQAELGGKVLDLMEALKDSLRAESPSDRFERLAADFHRETGLMAPGKDQPAALGLADDLERSAVWNAWLARRGATNPITSGTTDSNARGVSL